MAKSSFERKSLEAQVSFHTEERHRRDDHPCLIYWHGISLVAQQEYEENMAGLLVTIAKQDEVRQCSTAPFD